MRLILITICATGVLTLGAAATSIAQEQRPSSTPEATAPSPPPPSEAEPGNALCPVMPDEPIDPSFFSEFDGRKVYLCCKRCRTKFEADPEAYIANLPPLATPAAFQGSADATQQGGEEHQHAEGAEHTHAEPDEHAAQEEHAHDEGAGHDESPPGAEADHDQEHDHSAHAETASGLTKALSYLGRFHVLAIHFPIALLAVGALFEFASLLGAGDRAQGMVRASVGLGAVSALVAAPLGLMNAIGAEYAGVLSDAFWWHRLLGLTTAGAATLAWIAVEWRARKPSPNVAIAARVAVVTSAALVGITGHLGGSLVFGWEYLLP